MPNKRRVALYFTFKTGIRSIAVHVYKLVHSHATIHSLEQAQACGASGRPVQTSKETDIAGVGRLDDYRV